MGVNGGLAPPSPHCTHPPTPRGGPVQSTINPSPCLLASRPGHSSFSPRPLVGTGREPHSHARDGPALELPPPLPHPWSPGIQGPLFSGLWAAAPWPARRAWERQEGQGGRGGQGLSPSLHCPCWPSGSPRRTFESRPWRAASPQGQRKVL